MAQGVLKDRIPEAMPGAAAVTEQLGRVLQSRYFMQSKRYPAFLRFVVETTLRGDGETLHERLIGNAVFHRDASYDTNADPAVRITAAEVRKRLAQYYHEPEHRAEVRIELSTGTYKPTFHAGETSGLVPDSATPREHESSGIARVWEEAVSSRSGILFCIGVPSSFVGLEHRKDVSLMNWVLYENTVAFSDVLTQDCVLRMLDRLGVDYELATSESVSFTGLRKQPVVLIGALSNRWSVKAIQGLRYRIGVPEDKAATYWIEDSQTALRLGTVNASQRLDTVSKDYGLVAHFVDSATGQPTWLIAGLGTAGTTAAGEFMTSDLDLKAMFEKAPDNWSGRSFQAVLESEMVDGVASRPRLLAVDFW